MRNMMLVAGAIWLAATSPGYSSDIAGMAHIISGDAVNIGKTRLRLAISAPGLEQLCIDAAGAHWTCGLAARDELVKHAGTSVWTCQTTHTELRDRTVAKCTVDGEDIASWMVRSGYAIAFRRMSQDYEADEMAAKTAKAGLWAGAFISPPDWRRRNKQAAPLGSLDVNLATRAVLLRGRSASTPPSPDCAIKGHVNRSGTCIYHLPGSRWYARVIVEPDNGDRWYCSKEEAELASCRETKR